MCCFGFHFGARCAVLDSLLRDAPFWIRARCTVLGGVLVILVPGFPGCCLVLHLEEGNQPSQKPSISLRGPVYVHLHTDFSSEHLIVDWTFFTLFFLHNFNHMFWGSSQVEESFITGRLSETSCLGCFFWAEPQTTWE